MPNEFSGDLLYKLECGFPVLTGSARGPVTVIRSTLPSLCLFQALEIVLFLQLCDEGIIGSKFSFGGKILRYWRCDTVLPRLIGRHAGCVVLQSAAAA